MQALWAWGYLANTSSCQLPTTTTERSWFWHRWHVSLCHTESDTTPFVLSRSRAIIYINSDVSYIDLAQLLFQPSSPPRYSYSHYFRTKTQALTKKSTMTLLKCISLTALLSGASTAAGDTTDNVSSRLQVHVRAEKIGLGFSTGGQIHLDFCILLYICIFFCINFVGPLCVSLFHCGRIQCINKKRSIGGWFNLWGMSGGGVGSDIIILQPRREWGASDQINNCAQNNCNESMQLLLSIGFWWQREESLPRVWSPIDGNFLCTSCDFEGGHFVLFMELGFAHYICATEDVSVQWFFSFNGTTITDETPFSFFLPHIIFSLNY